MNFPVHIFVIPDALKARSGTQGTGLDITLELLGSGFALRAPRNDGA